MQRQKPEWKTFQEECGEYIPQVPYTHGTINGEDMFKTVQKMGKTVPGLDGWRIHELKALGLEAWQPRARIAEIKMQVGKVPSSYKQVSTPMMLKTKGTEVAMDHRGLAIFFIHYGELSREHGTADWHSGRKNGSRKGYTEQDQGTSA